MENRFSGNWLWLYFRELVDVCLALLLFLISFLMALSECSLQFKFDAVNSGSYFLYDILIYPDLF